MNCKCVISSVLLLAALGGCASTKAPQENSYVLREASFSGNKPYVIEEASKSVVCKGGKCKFDGVQSLPKAGLLGIATSSQMQAVASMVEASHNALMNRLDSMSETQDKRHKDMMRRVDSVEEALNAKITAVESSLQRRITDSANDVRSSLNRDIRNAITTIEEVNKKQSQGEITVFFPSASGSLPANEQRRLTSFLDLMFKGYNGGNVILAVKGNASHSNNKKHNEKLIRAREKAVADLVAKHLVNVSYEFLNISELGLMERESPVKRKGGQYQNVKLVVGLHGDIGEVLKLLQEKDLRQISPKPIMPEVSKSPTVKAPLPKANQPTELPVDNPQILLAPRVTPQPVQPQGQPQGVQQPQIPQLPQPRQPERTDKDVNTFIKEGLQQFPPKDSAAPTPKAR